jgi:putative MATE family efflux protein
VNGLAWPIILENIFQSLLGLVDLAMVARLGSVAVAGVGTTVQIVWVAISALAAVSVGTTVLVARATGAREPDEANRVTKQSLVLAMAIGLVLTIVGATFSRQIVAALGPEPDVVAVGAIYLRITAIMAPALVVQLIAGAALRGAGDSRTPMIATGGINIVNVVVAYALIFGHFGMPALGVAGSAWAAGISRAVGAIALLVVLASGTRKIALTGRHDWTPNGNLLWRLTKVGVPSMIEQLVFSLGMLTYSLIVIGLGTLVFATQRITFNAVGLSFMPGMGFAMAATTLTGQSLGAKRPDLAQKATWYAVKVATIWMSLAGLVLMFFGSWIMRIFTNDPQMVALGAAALAVIAISQPFQAIGQVFAGGLRGAGDTRFPMVISTVGIWLIRLPLGYVIGVKLGFGLPGVYAASIVDALVRAILAYARYRTGAWQRIVV